MKRSVLVLLFVMLVAPAGAQSAEDLFQQALRVERVASNPAAAIELYQQIVDLPDAGRELVARAWLQMGKAYEVLGEERAVGAYSRVVRDYPDLRDIAGEASERMAGLAGPVAKEEIAPGVYPYLLPYRTGGNSMDSGMYGAAPSHSGNLIAREGTDEGITIDDLVAGTTRDLGTEELGCEAGAYTMRFSPDDSKIAFSCWGDSSVEGRQHLRLFDLNTGASRLVTTGGDFLGMPNDGHYEIEVYDWTQDGRFILASIQGWCSRGQCEEAKNQVALVPIADGTTVIIDPTYIREEREFREMNACLMNNDSVMIAEYGPWDTDEGQVDVRLTDIETQTERVLLGEEGADYELFGCDKEKGVVYYSRKRFESMMLRAADLTQDGKLANHRDIRALRADTDAIMSQNGDLFYTDLLPGEQAMLEVEINPVSGSVSGEVNKISAGWGAPSQYSVAGNLSFRNEQGYFLRKPDGALMSLPATKSGGHVTDLAGPDFWLPVDPGSDDLLHYIVDGATGLVKDSVRAVRISPDHQTLYVPRAQDDSDLALRRPRASSGTCVDAVSRELEALRELFCIEPRFGWVLVDPVSGWITYQSTDGATGETTTWLVNPQDGSKEPVATGRLRPKWAGGKLYLMGFNTGLRRYNPNTRETEALPTMEELSEFATPQGSFAVSHDETRLAFQALLRRASQDVELTVIRDPLGLER